MTKKVRHQNRFIDRKFQFMLLLRTVVQLTVFLAVGFSLLFVWEFLLSGPDAGLGACWSAVWKRYAPAGIVLVALLPVVVHDTLRLSNRIAGPVFRIRGALRRLAQGQTVEPIKLRRNDSWQELAADFNLLIAHMETLQPPANRDATLSRVERDATNSAPALTESVAGWPLGTPCSQDSNPTATF